MATPRSSMEIADEIEELELEYIENEQVFDRRREMEFDFELQNFAHEEEDEEAIQELEQELEELSRERPEDEPSERTTQSKQRPLPIELTAAEINAAAKFDFDGRIVPLLTKSCGECHLGKSSSGDLDLSKLFKTQPLVVNRSHWVNVIQQLKVRSMPPADEPQPSDADRRLMAAWLTDAIDNFDYETVRQPG